MTIIGTVLNEPKFERVFMKDWGGMEVAYVELTILGVNDLKPFLCMAYGGLVGQLQSAGVKKGSRISLSGALINGLYDCYMLIEEIQNEEEPCQK